jgi:hypothetical protein
MIKNISDEGTFNGGYFILNSDFQKHDFVLGENLFVTYKEGLPLKGEIIKVIREAKASLKICSFLLTDQEVFMELQNVLIHTNVAVFIITQLDESKFSTSFLTEDELNENRYQSHLDIIKKLYCYGAHIRASKSAHAKFIIADRQNAIIMSANLTDRSLNQNPESGLYLSDNNSIKDLDNLFDTIFQEGTNYTKFLKASKDKQFIISRDVCVNSNDLFKLSFNSLRFTYEIDHHFLYNEIINIIRSAKSKILIATYSITALDFLPELLEAIERFIGNNGEIRIFCRAMNYRFDHLSNCATLNNLGCEVYGDSYNHSKGIVSDEKGMIFTANIDGNHGLKSDFEVGYITDYNNTKALYNLINWQISSAPYKFVKNPQKKDFFLAYSHICQQKNIKDFEMENEQTIKLNGDSKALFDRIDKEPIYLYMENKNICMISIGNEYYRAYKRDSLINLDGRLLKRVNGLESYLLRYKTLNIVTD